MSKMTENFDLQHALELLHEDDWLHPVEGGLTEVESVVQGESVQEKNQNHFNYWIAQLDYVLRNKFDVSHRAVARILSLDINVITRAIRQYKEVDYTTVDDIMDALLARRKRMGIKDHGED